MAINYTGRAKKVYEDAEAKAIPGHGPGWTTWSELPVAERARLTGLELRRDLNLKGFDEVLPQLAINELLDMRTKINRQLAKLNREADPFTNPQS